MRGCSSAVPARRESTVEPLFVLSLMMGLVATGYLWRRDRPKTPGPRALPQAGRERGVQGLRPGDVLQHLGEDLVVQEVQRLEETGRARLLCRLSGGRHLFVRSPDPPDPDDELWLLRPAPFPGGGADVLEVEGLRYRLSGRFPVEAAFTLGARDPERGPQPDRVHEHRGVGAARLLLVLHEAGGAAYVGEALPAHRFELLLAS